VIRHRITVIALIVGCLIVVSRFAFSELLKAPDIVPKEKGSIIVTENGKNRWTADWTMEPWEVDGRPAVRFTETGEGRYSPFQQDVRWSLTAVWRAEGTFQPLHFEKTFRNTQGAVIETDTKDFTGSNSSIRFVRNTPNAAPAVRTMSIPSDTITVEGMAGVLRSLPFGGKKAFPLHLFTNDFELWKISIESRGREMVHTPAGDFDCYKVEMVPHLGALDIFRKFFPKSHIWFTVAPPHFWVKYEGLENGVESPSIVMQLKSYEPASN
jgi:hypothetical protein